MGNIDTFDDIIEAKLTEERRAGWLGFLTRVDSTQGTLREQSEYSDKSQNI